MKKLLAMLLVVVSAPCWAYYEVLDTGETLAAGNYRLLANVQMLTSSGGANIGTAFDWGFQEQYGVRVLGGFGKTDYFLGSMFKWVPIPDVEGQPAVGLNVGLIYAKDEDVRDLTLRFEPLVSKKFTGDTVTLTPYVSLPFGLRTRSSETKDTNANVTWQFVAGSQVQVEKWKNLQFMGEIGLDLEHAVSHISVAALLYFDSENGPQIK